MSKPKKIRVGIIFGGKSAEHEVSLQSAKNIIEALDKKKYEPVLIGIDKNGRWYKSGANFLLNAGNPKLVKLNKSSSVSAMIPANSSGQLVTMGDQKESGLDVAFPILHGPMGEDGTMQGLLKLAGIPFVGSGVLGSAVGMDKDFMKRLFREAGLPTPKSLTFSFNDKINFKKVKAELGLPLFLKPANLGSSVGVSKAKNEAEFNRAAKEAFRFDTKIIIEQYIKGREIECSVLGNESPIASIAGEIIPLREFYSYEAKYIDETGSKLEIPAKLPQAKMKEVQKLAVAAFKVLGLEGMARVDFFLTARGKLYINEVNTIPGFTKISMYPKLWAASGISYSQLIDKLIQLAIARFKRESKLATGYNK
jgi:D-alanine-D-alanine ligase